MVPLKIAVWRYCANAKFDTDSNVGGGRISRMVIETLVAQGHHVHILDKMTPAAEAIIYSIGARTSVITDNCMNGYDAAVVLTGPFNVMYGKPVFNTYKRLASLRGKVIYCQWDVALPFHFHPELVTKFKQNCDVTYDDLMAEKEWHVLDQLDEVYTRSKGGKTVDYEGTPFKHERCFWELAELEGEPLKPFDDPIPAIGYFGSDRPGRMRELKRWFTHPNSPPVHIYGQWSASSRMELYAPNIKFQDVLSEDQVRPMLNKYRMTLYMADPAYVKTDFIAQRFIENAMACVPTFYSDKVQPTVERLCHDRMVSDVGKLANVFSVLEDQKWRDATALAHQQKVLTWARGNPNNMDAVLRRVLA